jgi:DNA-binding transcriptional MerR regulator
MAYFDKLKDSEFEGVKDLADAATAVLRSSGTSQEKGTVAEFPNERTIRFYLGEGLIGQPREKRGATSVFGYEHLLALLAIKKLQSDGLPISVIKTLIEGKSVPQLEAILGDSPSEADEIFTETFIESPLFSVSESRDDIQFSISPSASPPKKNAAKEYLESLLLGSRPSPPPSAPVAAAPPTQTASNSPASWQRYEVEPGLELHVRDDFVRPAGYRQMKKLVEKIKDILQR